VGPQAPTFVPGPADRLSVAWGFDGDAEVWIVGEEQPGACIARQLDPNVSLSDNFAGCGLAVAGNVSGAVIVAKGNDIEVYDGNLATDLVRAGSDPDPTFAPRQWSLWIPSLGTASSLSGYALKVTPGLVARLHSFAPGPAGLLDVQPIPGPRANLTRVAADESAPQTVYGVGTRSDGSGPWFGRWTAGEMFWEDLPAPSAVAAPTHVWIGEHENDAWIVVGGGNSIVRARLADVAP
jgi:hypothetical protein